MGFFMATYGVSLLMSVGGFRVFKTSVEVWGLINQELWKKRGKKFESWAPQNYSLSLRGTTGCPQYQGV